MLPKSLICSLLVFPVLADAGQISESFSSRASISESTAVWNQAKGLLKPTLVLKGWDDGTTLRSTSVELGDGSDGAFSESTWANFAQSVDSTSKIIYLDLTVDRTFQFTTFDLPVGWTIEPIGNNHLKIHVQGDMNLEGDILCSGKNGASSTGTGATALAGIAGSGRCGGSSGGAGGALYAGGTSGNGHDALSPSGLIGFGTGGTKSGAGAGFGGGAGGSWSSINTPGTAPTVGVNGAVGANGSSVPDPIWDHILGGAGGGGGSGSDTEAGGGGGGGGGVILLSVGGNLTLGANSEILADGGSGGSAPNDGGGGGSGGGGSIRLWVAGRLTLNGAARDAISANHGAFGNSPAGGDGGVCCAGRTWIGIPTGASFVSPLGASNNPPSELTYEGDLRYVTGSTLTAISKNYDTSSTLAQFTAATISGNASPSLEVAGSNDEFVSDDSGWVSSGNVGQLENKRYIRFRVSLNNTDDLNPMTADLVTIEYSAREKKDFDFKGTGCGLVSTKPTTSKSVMILLFLLACPVLMAAKHRFQE